MPSQVETEIRSNVMLYSTGLKISIHWPNLVVRSRGETVKVNIVPTFSPQFWFLHERTLMDKTASTRIGYVEAVYLNRIWNEVTNFIEAVNAKDTVYHPCILGNLSAEFVQFKTDATNPINS